MNGKAKVHLWGIILIVAVILTGCGGASMLTTPDVSGLDANISDASAGGTFLLGAWDVAIDTETGTAQISKTRAGEGTLNIIGFLESSSSTNIGVSNITLNPGLSRISLDVSITHPFNGNGQFNVFDVKGVVFGPKLLNADGLTPWMNPQDFSGVTYGYKDGLLGVSNASASYTGTDWGYRYFADGLGKNASLTTFFSTAANLANRGIFSEGSTNTRHYKLDFGTVAKYLVFNYAIVASYDWPTGSPPYGVGNFPIASANSSEAFAASTTIQRSNLWYDQINGLSGGSIDLDVEVWDWQGNGGTSVTATGNGSIPVAISASVPGSTTKSDIFSFTNLTFPIASTNPINVKITITDTGATIGSSWFSGLLPVGHAKYSTNVYIKTDITALVSLAGTYYGNKSINNFVLWQYPHQSAFAPLDFVDYYNFTAPPLQGRHDISVHSGPGTAGFDSVQLIDTQGVSPPGAPPANGANTVHFPLPLGSNPPIFGIHPGGPSPPYLSGKWMPTRFDGVASYETQYANASTAPYFMLPPIPEYDVIQQMHHPPGGILVPLMPDIATFMYGGGPWDLGVDVTNGFNNGVTSGSLYGLFFHDYTTWLKTGVPGPPIGGPNGVWIYELPVPISGVVNMLPLPSSNGISGPGPTVIDDSSAWGVCGSLAVDSTPSAATLGLSFANSQLVAILDTEGDVEIWDVDFSLMQAVNYGAISAGFIGGGLMAADIEMIDSSKVLATKPAGWVPSQNILAVAVVDGLPGPGQGDWWIQTYILNQGLNTATLHATTARNTGQPFLAMDIDEQTGDIYVLHGSPSPTGFTAITVYSYV